MTLTVSELRTLLKSLDLAARRFESQRRYYERRPDRYGATPAATAEGQAARARAMYERIAALRARRDVLQVA